MKFYSIKSSLNSKVLGHYPQVKDIKYNCDVWDEPKFIEHTHFAKINFVPITANAILHDKAKITDLINVSGMGFTNKLLVSNKLKGIFEHYRKTGLQFYESNLIHKNHEVDNYWVLNFFESGMHFINFNSSQIYLTENTFDKVRELDIKNFNEYLNMKEIIDEEGYPKGIFIEKFTLVNNVDEDFFFLTNVQGGVSYIVSEKLKINLEEENCTGIEFMPIEIQLSEWLHGGERDKIYGST
ncbi:hypothetical protein SOM12_04590 [Flavobacterium sp. CFBP9031]|uniref:imm11 family protein n=1 Tax=Flavobacterium sp. CFBP9031 TaxID=3096538 RepID=UPI002A6A4879|nr:DUF1629 domain-containing protein [Flavobacterium sp. CFBP9031]MDY0986682.1 hypothetical protein [Flavobacterium sp. CFBP9031]